MTIGYYPTCEPERRVEDVRAVAEHHGTRALEAAEDPLHLVGSVLGLRHAPEHSHVSESLVSKFIYEGKHLLAEPLTSPISPLSTSLGETRPLSQGGQARRKAPRIRYINGMEVRKKWSRGDNKRPRGVK